MASTFSNQIPVLLIFLLFLVEAPAIKCYHQPGFDPTSMDRTVTVEEHEKQFKQLFMENKDKIIEMDCVNFGDGKNCAVATECKIADGNYELRGCISDQEDCSKIFAHNQHNCDTCRICEGNLCNGVNSGNFGNGANVVVVFSSMLMLAVGIFIIFVPFMVG